MSGSDAPTTSRGVGGGSDACADIRLLRNLEAPVPGVADKLVVGNVLDIVLVDGPPELVAARTLEGQEAGGISPTVQLIACLRQGVRFEAEVTSVVGADIQLEVHAAP